MKVEELKVIAEAKWAMFFQSASAAGIWVCAFILSLGLAKWSDGAGLALALNVISFVLMAATGFLMIGAMLDAQEASREAPKQTKELENKSNGSNVL